MAIKVTYLNRDGGGFAEKAEVEAGTTIEDFLEDRLEDPGNYTLRIMRPGEGSITPSADDKLKNGDRISAVPLKIEGARS